MPLEGAQRQVFGRADEDHFRWVTEHAYVAAQERALVEAAFFPLGERLLDVGCGEGTTLWHLGGPAGATGVDASEAKVDFCRDHVAGPRFLVADAEDLPFEPGQFDHVIVRDVIHHLKDPARLVDETSRVLAAEGRLDVLEPCALNPLVAMHAVVTPSERGELRSTAGRLRALLERRFDDVVVTVHQALPLHRLVFHPRLGRPDWRAAFGVVEAVERMASRVTPRPFWSYLHLRGRPRRRA